MAVSELPAILVWSLPILFLVHDAEEAFFLPDWVCRNRNLLALRFPRLSARLFTHFEKISPVLFAAMAAEELLLLTCVTAYSFFTSDYYPWLALYIAFSLHLLVHLGQWMVVRRYIPVVATTLLCLPVCGWGMLYIDNSRLFSGRELLLCTVGGVLVAALNLALIHCLTARFARRR